MEFELYPHSDVDRVLDYGLRKGLLDGIAGLSFASSWSGSKELREQILSILRRQGWSDNVRLATGSGITITALHDSTALCLQTGNMGRFYADLLKLQYLFANHKVTAAIYVLPTKKRAKEIGSNVANFERLVHELRLFESIVTIPTLVVGLC